MSDPSEKKLTERQSHWLKIIKTCEASGKTMKAFAASEGLDINDLYTWKKALVKKGVLPRSRRSRFQRAQIIKTPEYQCRIVLPNGVTVIVSSGPEALNLRDILQSARQL